MLSDDDDNDDDDGFFEVYTGGEKDFVTCLGVTKLIINKQDVTIRTCRKVKYIPSKLNENK